MRVAAERTLFSLEAERRLPAPSGRTRARVREALQRYQLAHDSRGRVRRRHLALLDDVMKGFDERDYAAYYAQLLVWRREGRCGRW